MENLTVGFGNFRIHSSPQILWMPTALGSPESGFDRVPQDSPGDLNDANYSTRLDEILDGDVGDPSYADGGRSPSDEEDEEGFFYTGNDAPKALGYAAQLADVLDEDEAQAAEEAEEELRIQAELEAQSQDDDVFDYSKFKDEVLSDRTSPSVRAPLPQISVVPDDSPTHNLRTPYLHPTVSRLRSFVPQHRSRIPSSSTFQTIPSNGFSPDPSHFSAISRVSSASNLNELHNGGVAQSLSLSLDGVASKYSPPTREVFRWTTLRRLSSQVYPHKAATVSDSHMGRPTALTAHGVVCIGTDTGRTFVFDFRQELKCVCGSGASAATSGPVSALALSLDHTFLAVGHVRGHIYLYDLARPQSPARTVLPTDLVSVAAGRKEGHLFGSKIIQLGFVGARHTAIVSADDAGLAFYHSLGKPTTTFQSPGPIISDTPQPPPPPSQPSHATPSSRSSSPIPSRTRRNRKTSTILAMSSLPIASSAHPTDSFNLIALLTPIKLVIVGLKPSPRTWYRRHRGGQEGDSNLSTWRGNLAWFPSVSTPPPEGADALKLLGENPSLAQQGHKGVVAEVTKPVLAYSWGRTIILLKVRADEAPSPPPRDGGSSSWKIKKANPAATAPVGKKQKPLHPVKLAFEEAGEWVTRGDILALQWLNINQLMVLTATSLDVYDARTHQLIESAPSDMPSFASCLASFSGAQFPRQPTTSHPGDSLNLSVDVYKGKIFVLGPQAVQVGTLLSWADRILDFVQAGNFLSAIELARSYYLGEAPGNKAGLPEDVDSLRRVVGQKLQDLMLASARYVFSEDRLTDDTHRTPDGRSVDRTPLFEGLVSTTARACLALDDFDFLFDDLYDLYQANGITPIYLLNLQPFLLDGDIRFVPPRITQHLISYHESCEDFDMAERVIWHIDPICLDINQAIHLCQQHDLYDALIYVYNRALQDFVSPVVELIGLIRKVHRIRRERPPRIEGPSRSSHLSNSTLLETLVPNAYKVYPYLGDVLSGLTHPSQEPMPEYLGLRAKTDLYPFLFLGRSRLWQGKLVLTSDEDGGPEPTYPYLRLLIRFDAEAMLDALDLAFEDSYLNNEENDHEIDRQKILDALFELVNANDLSSNDITFLRIFIARNVPKYPQFIHLDRRDVRSILRGLATDNDQSTREDRQLAAECLLSAYSLRDDDEILQLFEQAGFFRILRSWHQQESKWGPLISSYLRDTDLSADEIFDGIGGALKSARGNDAGLPESVAETVIDVLPSLLQAGLSQTAHLIDEHFPYLHENALSELRTSDPSKEFFYLRRLIQPGLGIDNADEETTLPEPYLPSSKVSLMARTRYIALLCKNEPRAVLSTLESLPEDYFDLEDIVTTCEEGEVPDAVVWALDRRGDLTRVFDTIDSVNDAQAAKLARSLSTIPREQDASLVQEVLHRLSALGRTAIRICHGHSTIQDLPKDLPPDEMWFRLMRSQIGAVQAVSSVMQTTSLPAPSIFLGATEITPLEKLRLLVQETFTSLVQQSSSQGLSFPRLFRRLVDASSSGQYARKTLYTEFRLILGGMLESYRTEGDFLTITNRLVERDLFEDVEALTAASKCGKRMRLP
ncbi:hypothetical protein BS47DRAFT_1396315 [Hydnum rufescens UP504]|uniref:Vacuolar protein sorting-associated protein 8 central domain-containing protein n=1 Tax=Hydnum rufescens UP504 TaxID=1448309 RepID=A0A9P6AQI9_9AGAM|nr:hypothetical protein BS47DRAFT_1396315 [Hydnum rufescens UP504]